MQTQTLCLFVMIKAVINIIGQVLCVILAGRNVSKCTSSISAWTISFLFLGEASASGIETLGGLWKLSKSCWDTANVWLVLKTCGWRNSGVNCESFVLYTVVSFGQLQNLKGMRRVHVASYSILFINNQVLGSSYGGVKHLKDQAILWQFVCNGDSCP